MKDDAKAGSDNKITGSSKNIHRDGEAL